MDNLESEILKELLRGAKYHKVLSDKVRINCQTLAPALVREFRNSEDQSRQAWRQVLTMAHDWHMYLGQ